ncbi:TolC family protein [Prochlorococcus sp. AH-736-K09]|nr:TolC family protein [Prochlorococcus sp. AH-736-K09]
MFRKIINLILFLPVSLFITSQKSTLSQTENYINEVIEEKKEKYAIRYKDINNLILNNHEIKSLNEVVNSSSFNLSSKIAKRYPSIDLQANGLPKYVAGKTHNSNTPTTETSQFSANPSILIRWDVIEPLRASEIKVARDSYRIAKNNYDIKRKDLIQEAKNRYHKFKKSYQDIENKKFALELSNTSLNDAQSKFEAGIGTKFEVIEADAQLSRDKQALIEKKIEHKINKIALKEILNIKDDIEVAQDQKIIGFWNHDLYRNINEGLTKNLSLKNISLQKSINENQAKSFLNANKPIIYISNTFSSTFSKGDSIAANLDPTEFGSTYTNSISLNFSWNIFDGGQNKNSYKANMAQALSEDYSYKNLKNLLKKNISTSYLNLKLNEEKILSSIKEISSTKESLRLSRLRYDIGISTLKDVLVRQKELSNAKSKYVNAIYNYNLNLEELERLTFLEISDGCLKNEISKIDKKAICNIPK